MDESIYRLVSTGLLAVIVLLLILAVARLGRLLRDRGQATPGTEAAATDPDTSADVAMPEPITESSSATFETDTSESGTASTDVDVVEEPTPAYEQSEEPVPVVADAPAVETETAPEPEEGPYEKDGRWWYRRDGELLVYDDRTGQWVDPATLESAPQGSTTAWEPEAAVAEPVSAEAAPVEVMDTAPEGARTSVPVGSIPQDEPEPHPLDEARGWDAIPVETSGQPTQAEVAEASPAPIPEPVAAPGSIVAEDEGTPSDQTEAAPEVAAHWKCPACGVINGSTATTCRMCFAARP